MRALLGVILLAATLWGGYWFAGARALERGTEAWFADAARQGLMAERESLSVSGFPNRFDLTVTAPQIADPARGYGWQAPFMQVFSLTYKPWHVIAALPDGQVITTPFGSFTLGSSRLQGSLVVQPSTTLALQRLAVVGETLLLSAGQGWAIGAEEARFATRAVGDDGTVHEVGLDVLNLAPDATLRARLPDLPGMVEALRLSAVATLDAPLDRHAATTRPGLTRLEVKEALLRWGDISLFASGEVTADAAGLAEGRITLRLQNWRKAVQMAVAVGAISTEMAPTYLRALELLSAQSDTAELPLTFRDGRMSFGPLPLGPAPRMN